MTGDMAIAVGAVIFLGLCTLWLDFVIVASVIRGVAKNKHWFMLFLLLLIPGATRIGTRAVMRVIPGTAEYENVFGNNAQIDKGGNISNLEIEN